MFISLQRLIWLPLVIVILNVGFSEAKKKKIVITQYQGQVVKCHDGDTCHLQTDKNKIKIRFHGIDAPELKQQYGKQARDHLLSLIIDKQVLAKCSGHSFDRQTCEVFLNGENINKRMVQDGWAWESQRYSSGAYKAEAEAAKLKKIGIWKDSTESPYCFRHKKNKKCTQNKLYME
ncbi:MAG: thermonuclease family protein [Bdellovibrionia bacterium]